MYQNNIINTIHKRELIKKASGNILCRKNNTAEVIENTFTNMIIILISLRVIK